MARSFEASGDATDAALTDWLGRPVGLVAAAGAPGGHAESFADATDDTSAAVEWTMPPGRFVDALPLLLLTTASLRAGAAVYPDGNWDVRRFRPNLLIDTEADGWVEDEWCGQTVRVGDVELLPQQPCARCTMVTRRQPGLERDLDIYKTRGQAPRRHPGGLGNGSNTRDDPTRRSRPAHHLDPDGRVVPDHVKVGRSHSQSRLSRVLDGVVSVRSQQASWNQQ